MNIIMLMGSELNYKSVKQLWLLNLMDLYLEMYRSLLGPVVEWKFCMQMCLLLCPSCYSVFHGKWGRGGFYFLWRMFENICQIFIFISLK